MWERNLREAKEKTGAQATWWWQKNHLVEKDKKIGILFMGKRRRAQAALTIWEQLRTWIKVIQSGLFYSDGIRTSVTKIICSSQRDT